MRHVQLDAFADAGWERFAARMVEHVHAIWPNECWHLGDAAVRETVRRAIRRAHSHGMRADYDVGRFVDLAFAFSGDFDSSLDWARNILANPGISGSARMNALWTQAKWELGVDDSRTPKEI